MFHPGQKYKPSAARENEIDRMLRDYRAGSGAFVRPDSSEMPIGHILAKNSTGSDLGFGRVAMYFTGGFKNTEGGGNRRDYDPRKGFLTLSPMVNIVSDPNGWQEFGGLAVTLETIANNAIGRVAIGGTAIVAEPGLINADDQRYLYPTSSGIRVGFFGFGRFLAEDPASGDFRLFNLDDRKIECFYTLTANMSGGSAAATMSPGSTSWATIVHDVHSIAAYQKTNDTGFAEWRGTKWCIKIPFC